MAKQKVQLEDIIRQNANKDYHEIYGYILSKINSGILKPIKNSGTNGKKPALYNAYWKVDVEPDYEEVREELSFHINPLLDVSFYMKNPSKYHNDRENIIRLSDFLTYQKDKLLIPVTHNERSFQIFQKEKYLTKEGGVELLRRLGMSIDELNVYETSEPMSYFSNSKKTPQNFLIIENKDTFYSMRKHLTDGNKSIMDLPVETIIYGGGKRIYKSFEDFVKGVEPYFTHKDNKVWYFGDLDYEGILIYETLIKMYDVNIFIFKAAYEKMLAKALKIGIEKLPVSKEKQNNNIDDVFVNYFSDEHKKQIYDILESGRYIPQEILNEEDY